MRRFQIFAVALIAAFSLFGCSGNSIRYKGLKPSAATHVAVCDLESFLKACPSAAGRKYFLCTDPSMEDGSFGYTVERSVVRFFGADAISVSHAVYTFLEDAGYVFDFYGSFAPAEVKLDSLTGRTVRPRARYRGIRQHVNFPMDISSYPIDEAKAYLDQLLRMRFNKLSIHSYSGQWYETSSGGRAGGFFYGEVQYIYNNPVLKRHVRDNDSIFCIPAVEPVFRDSERRSKMAVEWMQELISYAKDLGFYVQFSFEPRHASVSETVSLAHDILKEYPSIDALELITEETGGWGDEYTADQAHAALQEWFSPEIAADPVVNRAILPEGNDLAYLYSQIGSFSKAIHELQAEEGISQDIKLGIYCVKGDMTEGAYRLARLSLPEVPVCLLSSHGSMPTAIELGKLNMNADDLRHTEIYSWVEFDGMMYLQQNSTAGNAAMMELLDSILPGEQLSSVAYNHWRTAENSVPSRYAAVSTIEGPVPVGDFYGDYARRLGLSDPAAFHSAMETVWEVDNYIRGEFGNIGFCWGGWWRDGGEFNAHSRVEKFKKGKELYLRAGNYLEELALGLEPGSKAREYLSFLGNRLLSSAVYLDVMLAADELNKIPRLADGSVPPGNKERALEVCDHVLLYMDRFIETYGRILPDRGSEGLIVSYWNSPVKGLKVIRSRLTGVEMETPPHSDRPIDPPHIPVFEE